MILHFQKEINIIMYIIEKINKTLMISFGQNLNKIWIFKFFVFVMFKMKYLINKMQCNTLSKQMWWLDGRGVCLHPKGQISNLTNGVFVVNSGKSIEYSLMWFPKVGAYLGWLHDLCT
jgi:hypothetical protein